jgi:hypothetical protein
VARPLAEMGILLEAKAIHPGLSACQHLHALAATPWSTKRQTPVPSWPAQEGNPA